MSEYSVEIERLVLRLENLLLKAHLWSRHFWSGFELTFRVFHRWWMKI